MGVKTAHKLKVDPTVDPPIEDKAIYAVQSDRGDSTGPLTHVQAGRELGRLQAESDEQHQERLRQGVGRNPDPATLEPVVPLEPERYEIVELGFEERVRHASRLARADQPGVHAGLGDEEVKR